MNTYGVITRRGILGATAATVLARPGLLSAQAASTPVRIGLLSDVGGPYRNVGGPGAKIAVDLAVEDFGGSLLGRPIEVIQSDIQNRDRPKPGGDYAAFRNGRHAHRSAAA